MGADDAEVQPRAALPSSLRAIRPEMPSPTVVIFRGIVAAATAPEHPASAARARPAIERGRQATQRAASISCARASILQGHGTSRSSSEIVPLGPWEKDRTGMAAVASVLAMALR